MSEVYAVHSTRPDDVGAVEVIFSSETDARAYAISRSRDQRVLSASVTRYAVGELGSRRPVAWYVQGAEQPRRFDRADLFPR